MLPLCICGKQVCFTTARTFHVLGNWQKIMLERYVSQNPPKCFFLLFLTDSLIDPFRIRRATSVPLGKGTKFALHHGKLSTTKRRAIQILHISTFQFTFKCGYNDFISKYTDINSLHATQITLIHNNTYCSTKFARFRCKKGSLRVNSVMILVVLSTHAELASATARGRSYWETGQLFWLFYRYVTHKYKQFEIKNSLEEILLVQNNLVILLEAVNSL